jgi:hypothetical protein
LLLAELLLEESLEVREILCIFIRLSHVFELSGIIVAYPKFSLQIFRKDGDLLLRSIPKLCYFRQVLERRYLLEVCCLLIVGYKLLKLLGSDDCIIIE